MSKDLTIVMYHYVRSIANSRYPNIKGLEFDSFKRQLDYFQENNSIVSAEDVIDASYNSKKLPTSISTIVFSPYFFSNRSWYSRYSSIIVLFLIIVNCLSYL